MGLKWTKNEPKMDQTWTKNEPKMDKKWIKNEPKMSQNVSKEIYCFYLEHEELENHKNISCQFFSKKEIS